MISNMIMKMWLCLNDVATMVKRVHQIPPEGRDL